MAVDVKHTKDTAASFFRLAVSDPNIELRFFAFDVMAWGYVALAGGTITEAKDMLILAFKALANERLREASAGAGRRRRGRSRRKR